MKTNFLRLRELLRTEFPAEWSEINGDNYPAPDWTNLAATVISVVQMFVVLVVLMGDAVWNYIPGFRSGPPEFYYKLKNNPALTFMILFLVIPSYVQSFANTGAFEIFLDDKLVSQDDVIFDSSSALVCVFANTSYAHCILRGDGIHYTTTKQIFSKLETGRMPNVAEIINALEKAGLQRGS